MPVTPPPPPIQLDGDSATIRSGFAVQWNGGFMANIAQSLIGDLERITVANPGGVQGVRPTLPTIRYSMKMK